MRGGLVQFLGLDWAGLKVGAALLLLVGLWLPWLIVFGAASLELVSNFLWREWNWSGCGGWICYFVGLSLFFFPYSSLFPVLSLGWPGFLTNFFCCPFGLGMRLGCCQLCFC